jgi:hypothetical protein
LVERHLVGVGIGEVSVVAVSHVVLLLRCFLAGVHALGGSEASTIASRIFV